MADDAYLVLSALGPDRPGLVAQVTETITEHGGNIEDSRMAVFGAEFGILILVRATPDEVARIVGALPELEKRTGLATTHRRTKRPDEHRPATVQPYVVTAEALDHEGIVRAVSKALHDAGVNIVSVETTTYNAPVTGSPLFRMTARIDVPRQVAVARVREAMNAVAEKQNIDIAVRAHS